VPGCCPHPGQRTVSASRETSLGVTGDVRACAHRRHLDFFAPAGAAIDLRTITEAQLPGQADAYLAQAPVVATDCDGARRQIRIGLDEGVLDLTRQKFEVRRVPYDIDAVASEIHKAGLPRELADRLYAGV